MEMKAMEVEAGLLDRAGPSDQKLETKTEAKEASKEYCKLNSPTDDIYSEAVFPSPKLPEVKPTKPTRSRRNVLPTLCIVLGVICLAELIIIFILNGKTAPTPVCPESRLQRGPVASWSPCFKNPNTRTTKSPDSHRCPDGWVFFKDFCYYRSNVRKSWEQGRTFCQNLTGDLAVISSEGIKNFLMQQIRVPHWIGLRYEGSWKWVDQTSYQGYLSTNNENFCASLRGKPPGNLESASCPVFAHFICQKKAS